MSEENLEKINKKENFKQKLIEDNRFLDEIFKTEYFNNKPERQISYLVGRYYSISSFLQKKMLKTSSLIKNLPNLTRRIDETKLKIMINNCNSVLQKIASKEKSTYVMKSDLRNRISDLLKDINEFKENQYDLGISFQMGFDSSLAQLNPSEEEENEPSETEDMEEQI